MTTTGRSAEFTAIVLAAFLQTGHDYAISISPNRISIDYGEALAETHFYNTSKHLGAATLRQLADGIKGHSGEAKPILVVSPIVDGDVLRLVETDCGIELIDRQKLKQMASGNPDLLDRLDQVLRA